VMVAWSLSVANFFNVAACYGCQQKLEYRRRWLCQWCQADLIWRAPVPLVRTPEHCTLAFAACQWNPALQRLIHEFKFRQHPQLAQLFGTWLGAHLKSVFMSYAQPDLVVSMPLSRKRLQARGYNQADALALTVCQSLSINYAPAAVRRLREVTSQHELGAVERQSNLQKVMQAVYPLHGRHVAIVDDVMTTGSSMSAVARALKKRGARQVDAWSLAYTAPPEAVSDDS